ncbi:MAG TPA: hypothetical protein VGF18_06840, partial [Candidatus Tumulicola sp.]
VSPEHRRDAGVVRRALALLERTRDARSLGIETTGEAAVAAAAEGSILQFLLQDERATAPHETLVRLGALSGG